MGTPKIELLTFAGCPHAAPAATLLQEVVAALAPDAEVTEILVRDRAHAAALAFPGSPTIRVAGRDIEALPGSAGSLAGALACRLYEGAGVPPRWLVEAAILRALGPRSYLFLCVANSARSQLAEGLGRALAPRGVTVASAGSEPTAVRPEAIQALAEIGIDITGHRSKAVAEIPADAVEAVITLCAEEVCPLWLGAAHRVHWGLPDPAAVTGPGRLDAFRATRDALQERLSALFSEAPSP